MTEGNRGRRRAAVSAQMVGLLVLGTVCAEDLFAGEDVL